MGAGEDGDKRGWGGRLVVAAVVLLLGGVAGALGGNLVSSCVGPPEPESPPVREAPPPRPPDEGVPSDVAPPSDDLPNPAPRLPETFAPPTERSVVPSGDGRFPPAPGVPLNEP